MPVPFRAAPAVDALSADMELKLAVPPVNHEADSMRVFEKLPVFSHWSTLYSTVVVATDAW